MFRFHSFRKFAIFLFFISTLMIFVNTTVFMVFSSLTSLSNQTRIATENNDINYTYGILPTIFVFFYSVRIFDVRQNICNPSNKKSKQVKLIDCSITKRDQSHTRAKEACHFKNLLDIKCGRTAVAYWTVCSKFIWEWIAYFPVLKWKRAMNEQSWIHDELWWKVG